MGKFNFPINNFTAGEWSLKLGARLDTDQYTKACETIKNFIPLMSGGAAYRGGTKHQEIEDDATQIALDALVTGGVVPNVKLVPFVPFDDTQKTLVVVTDTGTWYTLPDGQSVSETITDLSDFDPALTNYVQLGDYLVLCCGNGLVKPKIFVKDSSFSYGRMTDLEDFTAKVPKPWKAIPWGPIEALDSNVTLSINTASVGTGRIITASSFFFVPSMVGAYVRLCNGTSPAGICRITAVGVGANPPATVDVLQVVSSAAFQYGSTTNNQSFWQVSAWNDYYGWPRTVAAHQGRLIFGGNSANPDTIWGSRIGNHFDFEEVPEPNTSGTFGFASGAYLADNSRPFTLTPNSQEGSNIYALSSSKSLVINTDKSDIVAYGSSGALGPNDVKFESATAYGAEQVQPIRLNNFLTFVQRGGRKIRDMIFSFNEDQYKASDLNFVADHFTLLDGELKDVDPFKELARTQDQNSILWCRTESGQLYGCTLDRDYAVNAWFRLVLGRAPEDTTDIYNGGYVPIASICEFPEDSNNFSSLYMLVVRTIDGTAHLCLENMQPIWELGNPNEGLPFDANYVPPIDNRLPIYLDCAKQITKPGATATTTFDTTGATFNAFRNSTVSVVADGNYVGDFTVADDANGTLTLTDPANEIIIGYQYAGKILTFPIEQGAAFGSSLGRPKALPEMQIKLINAIGITLGYPGFVQEELSWTDPDQPAGEGIRYFTGTKNVNYPSDYTQDLQVEIEQNTPYPCHVTAIIASNGVTYD